MNKENDQVVRPHSPALRPGFLMTFCAVLGLGLGAMFDRWLLHWSIPDNATTDFALMAEAWNTIEHYYVDQASAKPTTLTYGAIGGMVDALGDTGHSVFLDPGMVKQLQVVEAGQLKGVGIEIQMKDQHVVIVAPIDDSPAQRAGLHTGEIIMGVNGRDITGLPLDQVVAQITGPIGTPVKLSIMDPKTHRLQDITLIREDIRLHDVTWQQLPGTEIADLRVASFNNDTARSVSAALRQIQQRHMRGLILDLRDNPGGILAEAISVASQFLHGGNVLLVKNAKGQTTPVPVEPGGLEPTIPMAVLVNGGSASASEIVAGALDDAHRAELIGQTTFGTGTVLKEFPLTDGSALLLAVQEWLTPDGRSFWHKGITPELTVALPSDVNPVTPAMERTMTAAELQSSGDKQLLAALKDVEKKMNAGNTGGRTPPGQ